MEGGTDVLHSWLQVSGRAPEELWSITSMVVLRFETKSL